MKKLMLLIFVALVNIISVSAQLKKVNEECGTTPCESGLFCVELKDGSHKCSTCDQSTLKDLTAAVENACKSFGQGWTPESSEEYQAVLAPDGRVLVDVFDKMLESAKKCKEAREYREDKCWNKGDDKHLEAIKQVKESIERMSAHKYKRIGDR